MRHLSCLELKGRARLLFRAAAVMSYFTERGKEEAKRMVSLKALSASTSKVDKQTVSKTFFQIKYFGRWREQGICRLLSKCRN